LSRRFDFLDLGSNFTKEDKTLVDVDLKGALGLLDSLEGKLS
jgi:hypothetical protein